MACSIDVLQSIASHDFSSLLHRLRIWSHTQLRLSEGAALPHVPDVAKHYKYISSTLFPILLAHQVANRLAHRAKSASYAYIRLPGAFAPAARLERLCTRFFFFLSHAEPSSNTSRPCKGHVYAASYECTRNCSTVRCISVICVYVLTRWQYLRHFHVRKRHTQRQGDNQGAGCGRLETTGADSSKTIYEKQNQWHVWPQGKRR